MKVFDRFISLHTIESTQKNYTRILKQFFKTLYGGEWDAFLDGSDEPYGRANAELALAKDYANKYFKEGRDYELDVRKHLQTKLEVAPKSYNGIVSVLKKLLIYNNIELPVVWQSVKSKYYGLDSNEDVNSK